MDAEALVHTWRTRLIAMADRPAYVFRNTPRSLIQRHYNQLTTFAGYSEKEIAAAEAKIGGRFPEAFREYAIHGPITRRLIWR